MNLVAGTCVRRTAQQNLSAPSIRRIVSSIEN